MAVSGAAQGAGYLAGKYVPQIISGFFPRNPQYLITTGDILSSVWSIPMANAGTMRFIGGIIGSIVNDL